MEIGVRGGCRLESETDVHVKWKASGEMHAAFVRLNPPNIPPSVQVTIIYR